MHDVWNRLCSQWNAVDEEGGVLNRLCSQWHAKEERSEKIVDAASTSSALIVVCNRRRRRQDAEWFLEKAL